MARLASRPLFLPHRYKPYVAVRPFRWKGLSLEPGDEIPEEWPYHHLRHLHTQSMIGPKGHSWSEQRMAAWDRRIARAQGRSVEQATPEVVEEALDQDVEEALEETRSLRNRLTDIFSGGELDGEPAGDSGST